MAIVTAAEVVLYTDITTSATAITTLGIIPIVQERINWITNNWFTSDKVYYQGNIDFTAAADTLSAQSNLEEIGFLTGDEFYLYNSYRNDGYYTAETVSEKTITIASSESVIAEQPSGASIMLSLVDWPEAIKYIAAQMVKYDYDDRGDRTIGVVSETLGPHSIGYGTAGFNKQPYGYPQELIDGLTAYTITRLL